MNKISRFTNLYPISKTLRFELIPQGKSLENMKSKGLIAEDQHRADSYQKVKSIIDEFHKYYIESVLAKLEIDVSEYADLYYAANKTSDRDEKMKALENTYREKYLQHLKVQMHIRIYFQKT